MKTIPLEKAVEALVQSIAARIAGKLAGTLKLSNGRLIDGHHRITVKKTEAEMRCRAPGCKQRSKGPRFHYLCIRHRAKAARTAMALRAAKHHVKKAA